MRTRKQANRIYLMAIVIGLLYGYAVMWAVETDHQMDEARAEVAHGH